MAVDYLKDYLGVDPSDYSAMERGIAGISPVGQSIVPRMGASPSRLPIKPSSLSDLPSLPFRNIERTPTPDFGSQITGLEEQIAQLMEQMQALESEKLDALNQQDTMRAELAQSQQDALAAQAEEFSGVKTNLEQQIADLTAQIGNMQAPVDVPPPVDDMRDVPPIVPPIIPPKPPSIGGVGGINQDFISDIDPNALARQKIIDAQGNIIAGDTREPPKLKPYIQELRPPIDQRRPMPPPPLPPRDIERPLIRGLENRDTMNDFMSIERLPDERDRRFPMPEPIAPVPPRIPPMPPRPRPGPVPEPIPSPLQQAFENPFQKIDDPIPQSIINQFQEVAGKPNPFKRPPTVQPINPMLPPQRTMSRPMMGGARGGFSGSMRPMMMRASGGTISQAIADLQNRFK